MIHDQVKARISFNKSGIIQFQNSPTISSTTPIGSYLNFHVQRPVFIQHVLNEVVGQKNLYGTFKSHGQGKTVVIDFSSPNIAKPFHSGHLKSTILGNFVRRIHDAFGYKTVAINYLGDWGKQYGKEIGLEERKDMVGVLIQFGYSITSGFRHNLNNQFV